MWSPPWFLSISLPSLLLEPLRPEARGSLETCHVTFGCQRSVKRVKRGPPVHISWKCRKPAQHPTSSGSTSSAALPVMSAGSRTDRSRKRRRWSARLPAGQSSRTPRLLWAKRFSPGWKSPDTQTRNPAGEAQVCATQRAGGLFICARFNELLMREVSSGFLLLRRSRIQATVRIKRNWPTKTEERNSNNKIHLECNFKMRL